MAETKRGREGFPYEATPSAKPVFGQPEDCSDLVNKYGTYNIQPTADAENTFPLIAHALPEKWRSLHIGKQELEEGKENTVPDT